MMRRTRKPRDPDHRAHAYVKALRELHRMRSEGMVSVGERRDWERFEKRVLRFERLHPEKAREFRERHSLDGWGV